MRVSALLTSVATFALSVSSVLAEDASEPAVVVTATFPEANPFGHVINGEKNSLLLNVENKSGRNVTLVNVAGSVSHPETNRLVKNKFYPTNLKPVKLTATKFGVTLPEDIKLELPYTFYSDISTYLMVAAIIGGLTYVAYLNLAPQPKKSRANKAAYSAPTNVTTPATAGGYQEEWIPEHHFKKAKKASGVATSGDELSASEISGTEGRKRKGKK
ncbi:hypothetical protein H0H93_009863 [Arthromyces matolae]|nr:hypothetical protein H0H93_009863 [Arthromyces matolae]